MKSTNFRKPRTTRPLLVTFRNGTVAGPYPPHYLRWDDTGSDFDVVAAEFADVVKPSSTWAPTSGGY